MVMSFKNYLLIAFMLLNFFNASIFFAQDINIKIGFRDSIKSNILKENRKILIHLPNNYNISNKSFQVMYQLDGDTDLLTETVAVLNRLSHFEEINTDLIVVEIENTNRPRDMYPIKTKYYSGNPSAENFLDFIEKELIPYIEKSYRTTPERILCGKSLSGLFTIYAFLSRPKVFNSYIACSAGFPDCENYFKELYQNAFKTGQYNGQKIFITNGLKDPYDPVGSSNQQIADFTNIIKEKLGNKVICKYQTYPNEGHVPFASLYDGLKYFNENNLNK
jgi:uncharacterized protein